MTEIQQARLALADAARRGAELIKPLDMDRSVGGSEWTFTDP